MKQSYMASAGAAVDELLYKRHRPLFWKTTVRSCALTLYLSQITVDNIKAIKQIQKAEKTPAID